MAKANQAATPVVDPNRLENRLRKTNLNHIFNFDVIGDGRWREVAVVKLDKNPDNSIRAVYYIDVALLDQVDKGRLKGLITNRHADKYELWDIMSQNTLSNGKNALDYFHQLVKTAHGIGAVNTDLNGGLAAVPTEASDMIGAGFTDPSSAALDTQAV